MKAILENISKKLLILFLATITSFVYSCKKQDEWLDVKRDKTDVVPVTLDQFQALMDNSLEMNTVPSYALAGADNHYLEFTDWQTLAVADKNTYIWAKDIYQGTTNGLWNRLYKIIGIANIVLEGLDKLKKSDQNAVQWDAVRGAALFYRGKSFYDLATVFAKQYDKGTSGHSLGIQLRTAAGVDVKYQRANLEETYIQLLKDLVEAENLLPLNNKFATRPNKTAAQAMLGRVLLNMGDYNGASRYSSLALGNYSTLIDFNTLNTTTIFPFPVFPNNQETIFWSSGAGYNSMRIDFKAVVDSVLFDAYAANDLRKIVFYKDYGSGRRTFKGSYQGGYVVFAGIAVNEVYLIKAEAESRLGNTSAAMAALNTLLEKRWKKGTFVQLTASDATEALTIILSERRKELPFTANLRWEDLKRLNLDPRFAKTLTRNLNGTIYTLPPNDNRYALPIPDDEIALSGVQQNPR